MNEQESTSLPESPAFRTAHHEAGHAVVGYLLGLSVQTVSIRANGAALNCGATSLIEADEYDSNLIYMRHKQAAESYELDTRDTHLDSRTRSRIESQTIALYAGPISEEIFCGDYEPNGAEFDHLNADERVFYLTLSDEEAKAYKNWLIIRARNILKQPDHVPMVTAVANALLSAETIGGDTVIALCCDVQQTACHTRD